MRLFILLLAAAAAAQAQSDWPTFGHDAGARRFSPLQQIDTKNVALLRHAWTFHTGKPGSEAVPIVVNGVMYLAASNGIFALVPETGAKLWHYEATQVALRGLAYWPGDKSRRPRVYAGVKGGMVALDAATGRPATGFANEGLLDLKQGVAGGLKDPRLSLQSPPLVFQNLVITGSANGEGSPSTGAYGDIRAWDADTGKLRWTFHTVPRPGEFGADTWPRDAWRNRSGTNAWGFLTLDVARGLLYVPLGSPTSDFYGADRHGNNLFGNSLVALDVKTGQRRWHQQLIHHDLWDFDPAAAPILFEADRHGRRVPAVAQVTKQGLLFCFHRVTGEPLYGMEERPVPQTTVPGEWTSPTQPFPLKPPPLSRIAFSKEEIYNLTPRHAKFCQELFEKNQMEIVPLYTPFPVDRNVLMFPSTLGGGGWGGLSTDPSLDLLFVNINNLGQWGHMEKKGDGYARTSSYGTYARFWDRDQRIPCTNPPYGELLAIHTRTGDIAWRSVLGTTPALEDLGLKDTGAPSLGGSMATAGGLVFIAATNDSRFRAFESRTGRLLWEHPLDANGHTIPITYLGKDGKQYVVVMAGNGGGYFGGNPADSLMAFALASPGTPLPSLSRVQQPSATTALLKPPQPTVLPEGPARPLLLRACGSACHTVETAVNQRRGRQAWGVIVDSMIARGARVKDDELKALVDYLARHFGAAPEPY